MGTKGTGGRYPEPAMWTTQEPVESRSLSVPVAGVDLHVEVWAGSSDQSGEAAPIVMLHEGLGSVTQWRSLPTDLATATDRTVVAFDRGGHGRSAAAPDRHDADFMHREAVETLPRLLAAVGEQGVRGLAAPVLVGHSDGASIALIATATGAVEPRAVCVIAPHVFVEEVCLEGIRSISASREQIVGGLARHHDEPALVFDRWRDVWLSDEFGSWNIESLLADITVPVIAVQGDHDEYATEAMLESIERRVPNANTWFLADCGHVAHRDQPEAVLAACVAAVEAAEPAG